MPVVEVPGQGNVEFPDSMSDEDIAKVVKRNSPLGYPSPTLPKQLQGPPPSDLKKMVQNVPSSAVHAIASPYGPGVPQGNPTFEGDYHGPTPESVGSELKGLIPHPIDDPVGTALQLATLGKFRRPIAAGAKGAAAGASEMVPMRHYGVPMDVPAPVAGAAAGGFAGWLSHLPHAQEIGAAIGGAAPIVRGAYRGVKEALGNGNDRFLEDSQRDLTLGGKVTTPQEAAGHNVHAPGVTQADEFLPPKVASPQSIAPSPVAPGSVTPPQPIPPAGAPPIAPPSGLTPIGGRIEPNGPSTPSATEVIKPNTQPPGEELIPRDVSAPITKTHFNKFSQTGGPYKIVSKGGAELGSYDTLADAQKSINDSSFAHGAVKVQVSEPNQLGSPAKQIEGPNEEPVLGQRHNSVQQHLEGIKNKIDNLIAHAQGVGMKVEDLERLHEEATQVDDPAVQHNAFEELKDLGRNAYESSKKSGRKVPASKYRSVSLDTLNDAIRVWKSMPKAD